MKFSVIPYLLRFKTPFRLAHGTRTSTQAVYIRLEHKNITGYGEATLPPYQSETINSVQSWIIKHQNLITTKHLLNPTKEIFPVDLKNPAASAALEMSVYNWFFKKHKLSPVNFLVNEHEANYKTTFTISKTDTNRINQIKEICANYSMLKLKLTGEEDDLEFVKSIISKIKKPFCVDINQGYSDKNSVLKLTIALKQLECILIEQPLKKRDYEGHLWLKNQVSIPIIADESIQNLKELKLFKEYFDGINIKIMKCGGLHQAQKMLDFIDHRTDQDFIKLLGCMSESTLGVGMATTLVNRFEYVDLDGPELISNDPFEGFRISKSLVKANLIKPKHSSILPQYKF